METQINIGITSMDVEEVINYFDTHMISQELEKKIYPKKDLKSINYNL